MKLLEERSTRLSLIIVLFDASAQTGPITDEIQIAIKNPRVTPVRHRLGYWLFVNLPPGRKTLVWEARWFKNGERAVDLDKLPRLRPMLEVPLTPLLKITSRSLTQGKVGERYRKEVRTTGGKSPLLFGSTELPAGLVLEPRKGIITGTPTASGQTDVTLTVTDGKGSRAEKTFTLSVVS